MGSRVVGLYAFVELALEFLEAFRVEETLEEGLDIIYAVGHDIQEVEVLLDHFGRFALSVVQFPEAGGENSAVVEELDAFDVCFDGEIHFVEVGKRIGEPDDGVAVFRQFLDGLPVLGVGFCFFELLFVCTAQGDVVLPVFGVFFDHPVDRSFEVSIALELEQAVGIAIEEDLVVVLLL